MQLPPMSVMATWPKPNYVDPVTRGNAALIVTVICIVLAFIVTVLRLYTRWRITCSAGLDDIFIIIALAFSIGMCVVTSIATEEYGWNRHIWDVPPIWLTAVNKLNLAFQVLFSLSSSFTKISLLWFCKRLLGRGSKGLYWKYNIGLIVAIVFVSMCCAAFFFASIFQCTPVKAYWEVSPHYKHTCLNNGSLVFAASVVNIFTDFLTTVLPMPLIWNLKLPTRQRIAVMSIFGLGIVVNVAGSVRTVYVWKSMVVGYDTTWIGWPILVAGAIEINMGLICASAPALRPLIASFLPQLLQSSRNYASYYARRRSGKPFSSNGGPSGGGPSKGSKFESKQFVQGDSILDRLEVMRTVEMETYSEDRTIAASNPASPTKDVSMHHQARVQTPTNNVDLKHNSVIFTSPGSEKSSDSLTNNGDTQAGSPFSDKHLP